MKLNNLKLQGFTFNPWQENTYVISEKENNTCWIIDPGCYETNEKNVLINYISENNLQPTKLINTHGHIDHMLGNAFIKQKYNIPFLIHKDEVPVLDAVPNYATSMGINVEPSPKPDAYLEPGETLLLGSSAFKLLYTPGHSPASVSLYCATEDLLFAGDVLFNGSIGRYDLPGGNYQTLMQSIERELMPLPDSTIVLPGHGGATQILHERNTNPFWLDYKQNPNP